MATRTVERFARTPEGDELAMTEGELDERCKLDDGEFTGIDDREYPELREPGSSGIPQLTHSVPSRPNP